MNIRRSRNTSTAEAGSAQDFVPAGWKLLALVFESLATDDDSSFIKRPFVFRGLTADPDLVDVDYIEKAISSNKEGINEDVESTTFEDAFLYLFYETCNLTSVQFPTALFNHGNPWDVLSGIRAAAKRIRDSYKKAEEKLRGEGIAVRFAAKTIFDNCELILSAYGLVPSRTVYEKELFSSKEAGNGALFLRNEILPLHALINKRLIEDIDFDRFYDHLELKPLQEMPSKCQSLKGEDIEDDDNLIDGLITPLAGFGMAMYAFKLIFMCECNRSSSRIPTRFAETESGELVEMENPKWWADTFCHRINWKKERYDLLEERWKDIYFKGDFGGIVSGASDKEKALLGSLCARATFEDIVSSDNLECILDHPGIEPTYDIYHYIYSRKDSKDTLKDLYRILTKECNYLHEKISVMGACFYDEDGVRGLRMASELQHEWKLKNNGVLSALYLEKGPAQESVYKVFFESRNLGIWYLHDQPHLSEENVSAYLKECIEQDEKLKVIVFQYLHAAVAFAETTCPDPSSNDGLAALRPHFINEKNEILVSKAKFVRALVSRGIVTTGDSWEHVFKESTAAARYKELYAPDSTMTYNDIRDEVLELARQLLWTEFDNKNLSFKGLPVKGKDLKKAFSDNYEDHYSTFGDPYAKYKSRIDAFRELYLNVMKR